MMTMPLTRDVLVAIDFSTISATVLNTLPDTVKAEDTIHLLYVCEPNPEFIGFDMGPSAVNTQIEEEFKRQTTRLSEYAITLEKQGYTVKQELRNGIIADEILNYANSINAKMIVLGRHSHSTIYNIVVGSVAKSVLKRSTVPVLLVP
jgi:nucleotide-binding universal stress UspA family protein